MRRRRLLLVAAAVPALAVAGFVGWVLTLPAGRSVAPQPPTPAAEHAATVAALRPPRRERPIVAIIGINDATETTDYLMPYGILRRAGIDVRLLSTEEGPVQLYPALRVEPDATIAAFDAQHPEGADYVIVPAMKRHDDPAAISWIRDQAARGAIVIGVCVGARVVGAAGLLDGRSATAHWFYLKDVLRESPGARYVRDRRIVVDNGVATTTGITASMPMTLTLIEAIEGREHAVEVARKLGISQWDARHDSGAFRLTRPFALTVLRNVMMPWRREQLTLDLAAAQDEVALALVADAWSRTYRSRVVTWARDAQPVTTRYGVRVHPDRAGTRAPSRSAVPFDAGQPPAQALDGALRNIESRYGSRTASIVAMQLEYPRTQGSQRIQQ